MPGILTHPPGQVHSGTQDLLHLRHRKLGGKGRVNQGRMADGEIEGSENEKDIIATKINKQGIISTPSETSWKQQITLY